MAEKILTTEYSTEMQQSYINYSMSVITARAVPDIRDGLKPVQRRVLYAMNELGLNSDKPHRKSARIVGDAMGKYHPHGDSSIYEALVVLSQDFKKGMALVDGHGNFGSIEGDGAAAMRYTEARLKKFTQEVYLADLDKDVVDFVPNFDEQEKEPEVLPVRIPNFLVNGSEGIAVGMTTSTPTHNLAEVIDAMKVMIENPDITTEELMIFMKGPDFPTGGIVTNKKELLDIYTTGKGKIKIRGKAEIERGLKKTDRDRIVIREIPYTMIGSNISKFLMDVAALVETRKLPDIVDISNQSNKEGIKIVLELKKGADAEKILQGLYKKTKLEDTFGVNMLAIVDGKPEVLGLRDILKHSIDFQVELNTRKYTTLLAKEEENKEIQEGLIRAVDVIDLIIEIIRGSRDIKMAKKCLVEGVTEGIKFKTKTSEAKAKKLHFTQKQATAILELRLSKLIGLEIEALMNNYQDTLEKIEEYTDLLNNRSAMMKRIKKDLDYIRKNYGVKRRTVIADLEEAVFEETPREDIKGVFLMNRFGYSKFIEESVFAKNEELLRGENQYVIKCTSASRLWLFTREGTMHKVMLKDIPLCKVKDKGVPIDNVCNYDSAKESLIYIDNCAKMLARHYLFITEQGFIKSVSGEELDGAKKTMTSTKLNTGDHLIAVLPADRKHCILISDRKRILKFPISEVSEMKKTAAGVRGMKLDPQDSIRQAYVSNPGTEILYRVGDREYNLTDWKIKKRDAKPDLLK